MADGRQHNGGARPGAGRKPKRDEQALADLLDQAWPVEEREATIRYHALQAARGDRHAFKLLMAYAYGTPVQRSEISGPDGGAIPVSIEAALDRIYGTDEQR